MTTSPLLAWTMLAAVTVPIFLLPLLPCWREWRSPTDLAPLVIVRDEVNNVHHFAEAFRDQVTRTSCRANATDSEDPPFHRTPGPADTFAWDSAQQPVIVNGSLHIDDLLACTTPVYSSGDALLPGGARLPGLLCKGNATLGPGTIISEWAHADGTLSLGPGGMALHRLTAGVTLLLGKSTGFCRMHAPVIRFGMRENRAATPLSGTDCLSPAWPGLKLAACGPARYRANGDVRMPVNHYLEGSLIASAGVSLDDSAAIFGAVKARGDVRLGRGVQIHGALVCEGDIEIGPDCWIKGPIACEGDVRVAHGSRIGTAATPTTLAASRVLVEQGVIAHGTVWARNAGVVSA